MLKTERNKARSKDYRIEGLVRTAVELVGIAIDMLPNRSGKPLVMDERIEIVKYSWWANDILIIRALHNRRKPNYGNGRIPETHQFHFGDFIGLAYIRIRIAVGPATAVTICPAWISGYCCNPGTTS